MAVALDQSAPALPPKKGPYATFADASRVDAAPQAASRYLDTANEVLALLQSLADRAVEDGSLRDPELTASS